MAELSKIKIGSVVRLASGGPKMTAERQADYRATGRKGWVCVWMDETGHMVPQRAEFYEDCLIHIVHQSSVQIGGAGGSGGSSSGGGL